MTGLALLLGIGVVTVMAAMALDVLVERLVGWIEGRR